MADLILPENVTDATGDYTSVRDGERDIDEALDFRRYLKQIDERLDLIYVKSGSRVFGANADGSFGNRWVILRRNEGAPVSFWKVEDTEGQYCAPDERHLNRLREYDTARNPRVWKKFETERINRKLRADKALDDKSEEFRTKLKERLDHIFDTRIAVTAAHKEKLDAHTARSE